MKNKKVSKIGGQAVLEGVMMRGEHSMATAVRDEFKQIVISSERISSPKERNKLLGLPVIRGVVAFFDSLVKGTKILIKSAEVYGADMGEPSKFELWLAEKTKIKVLDIAIFLGLVFGLGLSIGLFFILPVIITTGLIDLFNLGALGDVWKALIAGFVRIFIFVAYIFLVSFIKDIRRTFMYHGAEHKVINCYENELPMTVENAQSMSTRHDRCGTTFLFLVMMVSIIFFAIVGWGDNLLIRIGTRLALLPVVAGVSYELLKLLAKSDNFIIRIFKYPGLLLQKITTKEPTDDMVEVALMAFNTVQAMEEDKTIPAVEFNYNKSYSSLRSEIRNILAPVTGETAEIDWIISEVTNKKRSELSLLKFVNINSYNRALEYAKQRATGKPLQYILGSWDFYNFKLKLDNRALIPRPETEILVEKILPYCSDKDVLDLCTGSGAIALAIANNCTARVTATDISAPAIDLARENANNLGVNIELIISDLFNELKGRKFDIITANPPYIKTDDISSLQMEVKDYEPYNALDGGDSGLEIINRIVDEAGDYLTDNGTLIMELGIGQATEVAKRLNDLSYSVEIIKDLEGIDRFVKAEKNV